MPARRLKEFLEENRVEYATIRHSLAYTAQEIAAVTHIKGRCLAKTVIVRIDGEMAMAVVPASYHVDVEHLRVSIGAGWVMLASEEEFQGRFPQCEVGAIPPFGNLYGMEVYLDRKLAEDEEITFSSGCHTELVRMAFRDFAALVRPRMMDFRVLLQAA